VGLLLALPASLSLLSLLAVAFLGLCFDEGVGALPLCYALNDDDDDSCYQKSSDLRALCPDLVHSLYITS
jgi:hypothetical protein